MTSPNQGLLGKALAAADAAGPHPVVSAVQFAHLTRTTGGATMNAHDLHFTVKGDDGYAVGGSRNTATNRRIKTDTVQGLGRGGSRKGTDVGLDTVLGARRRIRRLTQGNPDANVGSWTTSPSTVDVDAVDVEHDRAKAIAMGTRRREAAIFDMKRGKDIIL